MLCRNLARAAAATPHAGVRALSTTASRLAAPSMGDIQSSQSEVEAFNQKQKQFREQLAEAQKKRGVRAFGSQTPTDPPSSPNQSAPNRGSPSADAGASRSASDKEPKGKPGALSSLIYGTKEGRELEAQIEASFSQVLARGKYVHSIVFHEVKPDKVDEYVDLVGHWYPKMANTPENKVHLVGSWRTEVGDCDTFGMAQPSSASLPLSPKE